MDKETIAKLDKKWDLLIDINKVVTECVNNNNGIYKITTDDIELFISYIAEKISKYEVVEKCFFISVDTLEKEYQQFHKMYHKEHSEFRDYKMVVEKRVKKLLDEKQFFIDLLMEKCEELDKVKKKLSAYED